MDRRPTERTSDPHPTESSRPGARRLFHEQDLVSLWSTPHGNWGRSGVRPDPVCLSLVLVGSRPVRVRRTIWTGCTRFPVRSRGPEVVTSRSDHRRQPLPLAKCSTLCCVVTCPCPVVVSCRRSLLGSGVSVPYSDTSPRVTTVPGSVPTGRPSYTQFTKRGTSRRYWDLDGWIGSCGRHSRFLGSSPVPGDGRPVVRQGTQHPVTGGVSPEWTTSVVGGGEGPHGPYGPRLVQVQQSQ